MASNLQSLALAKQEISRFGSFLQAVWLLSVLHQMSLGNS
jgi:hypothetical protein